MRNGSRRARWALILGLAALSGSRSAVAEEPLDVAAARSLAASFPVPTTALGFTFDATGQRVDPKTRLPTIAVEVSVRAEPFEEGPIQGWKVTETWSAKLAPAKVAPAKPGDAAAAGVTSRRVAQSWLLQDLTPLKGSTFEEGTSTPTKVEWLGGDKALAVQVAGKEKRLLRTAWYAGQPVIEIGGVLLFARLMGQTSTPCRVDFCAPSWNRLTGEIPGQAFLGVALLGSVGPDMEVQEPNAPESTHLTTWGVRGEREDKTSLFTLLLHGTTGLPLMVTVNGVTYAGDSRPLPK